MRPLLPFLLVVALGCGEGPGPAAPSPGTPSLAAARDGAKVEPAREWNQVTVGMQRTRAEVVRSGPAKVRGLSGRRRLPEGTGMLFVYDRPGRYGFWMPDMHFDIDIVWILRDRVVHIESDVPHDPVRDGAGELPTYRPDADADLILEVPAGTAERYGWRVGDPVSFDPEVRSGG